MKVLLKSLEEIKKEYGVEKFEDAFIVSSNIVYSDMISLLGKIVEAEYDKRSDSYIINAWYYDPKLVKGIVTGYNIKDLNNGKEYTFPL